MPAGISATEAFGEKTSPLDLRETEKKLIAQALAATNGNVTAAAKKLGISRRTLHRKINEMSGPAMRGGSGLPTVFSAGRDNWNNVTELLRP